MGRRRRRAVRHRAFRLAPSQRPRNIPMAGAEPALTSHPVSSDPLGFPHSMQPAPGKCGSISRRRSTRSSAYAPIPTTLPAPILGTERTGCGVVISDDGLVLTIGYLITGRIDLAPGE